MVLSAESGVHAQKGKNVGILKGWLKKYAKLPQVLGETIEVCPRYSHSFVLCCKVLYKSLIRSWGERPSRHAQPLPPSRKRRTRWVDFRSQRP